MRQQVGVIWGVFDLFHVGHLRILQKASRECDHLFVGVFTSEVVKSYKGSRPIISEMNRLEIIKNLKLNCMVTPFLAIKREHMNTRYTFPREQTIDIVFVSETMADKDLAMVNIKTYKKRIHYLPYTKGISTGDIIDIIQSGVKACIKT